VDFLQVQGLGALEVLVSRILHDHRVVDQPVAPLLLLSLTQPSRPHSKCMITSGVYTTNTQWSQILFLLPQSFPS
jgi:hypothetical protein